jgi:cardiolipin synthase
VTIPNALSALRLVLTPWIARAVLNGETRVALALLLFAGLTDVLDGVLARRFAWTSRWGAYLDPIADKVLLSTLYLCFGLSGMAPGWLVAIVFGRDILILLLVALAMMLTGYRSFPPSIWGKVSTVIQIAAAVVFLTNARSRLSSGAVWSVAIATVWSGLHYLWRAVKLAGAIRTSSLR